MSKLIDLTGQQFEKLTVIKRAENNQNGKAMWECQCECGNITTVRGHQLRTGRTKSCGCLIKEQCALGAKKANTIDLTGQKFGKLTVLNQAESKNGLAMWNCQCECGNEIVVRGNSLRSGHTKSCGCVKSIGEANIEKLLLENNISYKKEYTFEDLKDKHKLRFDFAIFDNDNNLQYLVEFDGIQHFESKSGWNDLAHLEKTKLHDQMKNDYCKEHNIPLIRIPYWKRGNLTIEDLLLETGDKELKENK